MSNTFQNHFCRGFKGIEQSNLNQRQTLAWPQMTLTHDALTFSLSLSTHTHTHTHTETKKQNNNIDEPFQMYEYMIVFILLNKSTDLCFFHENRKDKLELYPWRKNESFFSIERKQKRLFPFFENCSLVRLWKRHPRKFGHNNGEKGKGSVQPDFDLIYIFSTHTHTHSFWFQ